VGLGVTSVAGCTHNYYYGTAVPVCPPATAATTTVVPYGSVCDVPSQVVVGSGTTITQAPDRPLVVSTPATRPPRVVVSEPAGGSRFSWRRSDPDSSLVTTRSEGALDEPTISR
jgi:hypothetical protein